MDRARECHSQSGKGRVPSASHLSVLNPYRLCCSLLASWEKGTAAPAAGDLQVDTHKHTTIIKIRKKRQVSVCYPPCASSNSPSVWATGSWAHHRRSTIAARGHSCRESAAGAAAAGPPAAAACCSSRSSRSRRHLSASAPTLPAHPHPDPAATGSFSSQ